MRLKRLPWFFAAAVIVLYTSALAKIYSAFDDAPILHLQDAIFPIENRTLLLCAASIELLIAYYVVICRSIRRAAMAIFWLAVNMFGYRIGLFWMGETHCACLGTIGESLPISPENLSTALAGVVIALLSGSSYYLAQPSENVVVEQVAQ